jgi:hypothetical protein
MVSPPELIGRFPRPIEPPEKVVKAFVNNPV